MICTFCNNSIEGEGLELNFFREYQEQFGLLFCNNDCLETWIKIEQLKKEVENGIK